MIKKILVTLDGSDRSDVALEYALWLSNKFDSTVVGLHVVDIVSLEGPFLHDISGSMGFEPYLNFSAKMREILESKGRGILDRFEEAASGAGVEFESELSFGVVINEICERAKLADLVVMGRRGVNALFEHGFMGSATEGVIRKSPKPVLVTPAGFTEPTRPMLAFDGSQNSAKAMHSAAEWVAALGLPLKVVHASNDEEAEDPVLADAESYLKPYGIEAEYVRLGDDSPVAIETHYRDNGHDLLFMGTSHHSRIVEMVLGSTTEHVIRSIPGPFFIER